MIYKCAFLLLGILFAPAIFSNDGGYGGGGHSEATGEGGVSDQDARMRSAVGLESGAAEEAGGPFMPGARIGDGYNGVLHHDGDSSTPADRMGDH